MGLSGRRALMKDICRKILCMGLASLLIIALSSISLAKGDDEKSRIDPGNDMEPQHDDMMPPENEGFPMGIPQEVLYGGHGFALKDNESHILRLKIETIMPLQPGQIRDLLSSNKSLEEISNDIQATEGEAGEKTVRGSMILDRRIYPLVDIAISSPGDNTTSLKANLADTSQPTRANDTSTIGGISIIISPSDGGDIGKGKLDIINNSRTDRYSVLLDMEPSRQNQKRMMIEG